MGLPVNECTIHTLLFADDQLMIAHDLDDIEFMKSKLIQEYNTWGLKVNMEETK